MLCPCFCNTNKRFSTASLSECVNKFEFIVFLLYMCSSLLKFRTILVKAYIFLKYFCLVDGRSVVPVNGIVFGLFDIVESKHRVFRIIHPMQPIDTIKYCIEKNKQINQFQFDLISFDMNHTLTIWIAYS